MNTDVDQEEDRIVVLLESVGLRATLDPRDAKAPPVALLDPAQWIPVGNNCANKRCVWTLHLITKQPDRLASRRQLNHMADLVWGVLKNLITSNEPTSYPLNDTTDVASRTITFETVI